MFDHVGEKIQKVTVVACFIGIVISIIGGILLISENALLGIAVIIFGSILSWVGSLVMYGFGELVANTAENQRILSDIRRALNNNRTDNGNQYRIQNDSAQDSPKIDIQDKKQSLIYLPNGYGMDFDATLNAIRVMSNTGKIKDYLISKETKLLKRCS